MYESRGGLHVLCLSSNSPTSIYSEGLTCTVGKRLPRTSVMTTYTVISALLLAIPALFIYRRVTARPSTATANDTATAAKEKTEETAKTIMQAPRDDLAPPKDDPFTLEQLRAFDGSDPSKPIYVAIKGACTLGQVTHGSSQIVADHGNRYRVRRIA